MSVRRELLAPPVHQRIIDFKLIKDPADNEINEAIQRFDAVIPTGHGW